MRKAAGVARAALAETRGRVVLYARGGSARSSGVTEGRRAYLEVRGRRWCGS